MKWYKIQNLSHRISHSCVPLRWGFSRQRYMISYTIFLLGFGLWNLNLLCCHCCVKPYELRHFETDIMKKFNAFLLEQLTLGSAHYLRRLHNLFCQKIHLRNLWEKFLAYWGRIHAKKNDVWNHLSGPTITSPYVHSRVNFIPQSETLDLATCTDTLFISVLAAILCKNSGGWCLISSCLSLSASSPLWTSNCLELVSIVSYAQPADLSLYPELAEAKSKVWLGIKVDSQTLA